MIMRNSYSRVKDWNTAIYSAEVSCLQGAFRQALQTGSNPTSYFFDNVYIPVKIPTASGMPDDFTYEHIGWSIDEVVEIYNTYYGANFLIEPLYKGDRIIDYSDSVGFLSRRIKSVLEMNKGKYLKLMELQGYSYNPLWNVDGVEDYTYLENQGVNNVATVNNTAPVISQTNTYDGTLRDASKVSQETLTGGLGGNSNTSTTYTHNNAKNLNEYDVETDYTATSTFGGDIKGGDKFHTERKIRQGNIGVTKTQELIEAERENLKFVVLEEFFRDLNKEILIGIF